MDIPTICNSKSVKPICLIINKNARILPTLEFCPVPLFSLSLKIGVIQVKLSIFEYQPLLCFYLVQ